MGNANNPVPDSWISAAQKAVAAGLLPAGRLPFGNLLLFDQGDTQTPFERAVEALKAGAGAVRPGAGGVTAGIDWGALAGLDVPADETDAALEAFRAAAATEAQMRDRAAAAAWLKALEGEYAASPELGTQLSDIDRIRSEIRSGETLPALDVERAAIDAWANKARRAAAAWAAAAGAGGAPEVRAQQSAIDIGQGDLLARAWRAARERRRQARISEGNRLVSLGSQALASKYRPRFDLTKTRAALAATGGGYGAPIRYTARTAAGGAARPMFLGSNAPTFENPFDSVMRQERGVFESEFTSRTPERVIVGYDKDGKPIYKTRLGERAVYDKRSV